MKKKGMKMLTCALVVSSLCMQAGDRTEPITPLRLPGSNTVLTGAMVYNDKWGEVDEHGNFVNPITAGIYNIEAKSGGSVKKQYSVQDFLKMRAGTKVNNLYYVISTSNYDSEATLSIYYTSNWSRRSSEEIDVVNVPSDLTYDPVSGNVYGFFWNDTYQEYDRFCRFNTVLGEAEDISFMDRNCFAIAANAKGELYGIWGYTGWLIKINPENGRYEQIGRTGFSPSYVNSLTFDDATGKLYWTANDAEGGSYLLEVDTETGAATELMHFEDNASFAGIFAQPYKTPDAAPAAPGALAVVPATPTSLQATVSLTAPNKTYNGAPLSEPLTVAIDLPGQHLEFENVNPGAEVRTETLTLPEGMVQVKAVAATAQLLGAPAEVSLWVGEDIPAAPTSVGLEELEGKPFLTWTAPTVGQHGGALDPTTLTYIVTRTTDGQTFAGITATEWTDETYNGGSAAISYTVRSVNPKGESSAVESAKLVFGEGFTPPFTETFSTMGDFQLWSVFDLNGQTTWEYDSKNKNIYYSYSKDIEIPGDDWVISPKINLEAGKTYRLSADVKSYYKGYPENFRFCLGNRCLPEAMTRTLLDCPGFENTKGETKKTTFTVDRTGSWYLGLYCYSIAHNWQLTVDNITIEEVSDALPAGVENLSVTPAPQGGLEATVAFTMPTADAKGASLQAPLSAAVYRDHGAHAVATFTDLTPGQEISWKDTGIAEAAMRHYRVAASNEAGEGTDAAMEIWVGEDVAGAVQSLSALENPDGSVFLSWEAPVDGAHGGWFKSEGMTYRVIRSDGNVIAEDTTEISLTDNTLPRSGQVLLYYLVTPYVDGVKGQYANTPYEVYGPAIAAPLAETFPDADMSHYPWVSESDGPVYVWSLETVGSDPVASDQNGDKGMAMFVATEQSSGITGTLASPKINLAGLSNPELTLWAYHTQGNTHTLSVDASADGGEMCPIEGAEFAMDGSDGWMRHSVSLAQFKQSNWIRIALRSTSMGGGSFYVDNISVAEAKGKDAQALEVTAPARVGTGLEFPVEAVVANTGSEDLTDVKLTLTCGGVKLAETNVALLPAGLMARETFMASLTDKGATVLRLEVTAQGDTDASNNATEATLKVTDPIVPVPDGLECVARNGEIQVSWSGPESKAEVEDDIESYPDWSISGFGGYTMFDLDGDNTYYINHDLGEYQNATAPKAFQVCNARKLGIDIWPEGTPHSGNKMLMCMASSSRANDDWLVLPRLNGAAQTVSFWAKAFTAQDTPAERMRVLASETGCNPADFTPLHSEPYIEVPESWTLYSWYIPEGTEWLAVNCVSNDAFSLFVDDVRFNDFTVMPARSVEYAVYRNGTEVARTTTIGWTDTQAANGTRYKVKAIYPGGAESAFTPEVTLDLSQAETLGADGISITASKGMVNVSAPEATLTHIYGADGSLAAIVEGSGSAEVEPGIYIVKAGSRIIKLNVVY